MLKTTRVLHPATTHARHHRSHHPNPHFDLSLRIQSEQQDTAAQCNRMLCHALGWAVIFFFATLYCSCLGFTALLANPRYEEFQ